MRRLKKYTRSGSDGNSLQRLHQKRVSKQPYHSRIYILLCILLYIIYNITDPTVYNKPRANIRTVLSTVSHSHVQRITTRQRK